MVVVVVAFWWCVSCVVLGCMFIEIFWSFCRIVKYLGSSLLAISKLQICGIGL